MFFPDKKTGAPQLKILAWLIITVEAYIHWTGCAKVLYEPAQWVCISWFLLCVRVCPYSVWSPLILRRLILVFRLVLQVCLCWIVFQFYRFTHIPFFLCLFSFSLSWDFFSSCTQDHARRSERPSSRYTSSSGSSSWGWFASQFSRDWQKRFSSGKIMNLCLFILSLPNYFCLTPLLLLFKQIMTNFSV